MTLEEERDNMPSGEELLKLQKEDHTFYCALRILTGNGKCECGAINLEQKPEDVGNDA